VCDPSNGIPAIKDKNKRKNTGKREVGERNQRREDNFGGGKNTGGYFPHDHETYL